MSEPIADRTAPRPVTASEEVMHGRVWDVVRQRVDLGEAGFVVREYVRHPGAVGVLALDDEERVLLIRQYRHPVRMDLWELPAGIMDVAGEPPVEAARRELLEEADLKAEDWNVLVDWFNSPGGNDEAIRVYLARGVSAVDDLERHVRTEEEADIVTRWVPLDEALDGVLSGRLHNPTTVVGVLAAWASRQKGWAGLRPDDEPWRHHPRLAGY